MSSQTWITLDKRQTVGVVKLPLEDSLVVQRFGWLFWSLPSRFRLDFCFKWTEFPSTFETTFLPSLVVFSNLDHFHSAENIIVFQYHSLFLLRNDGTPEQSLPVLRLLETPRKYRIRDFLLQEEATRDFVSWRTVKKSWDLEVFFWTRSEEKFRKTENSCRKGL